MQTAKLWKMSHMWLWKVWMRWGAALCIFRTDKKLTLEMIQETNSKQASQKEAEKGRLQNFLKKNVQGIEIHGWSRTYYTLSRNHRITTWVRLVDRSRDASLYVCWIYILWLTHLLVATVGVRVWIRRQLVWPSMSAQTTDSYTSTVPLSQFFIHRFTS